MKKSTKIILMISICLISVGIVFSTIGVIAGASPSRIVFNGLWNYTIHYEDDYKNNYNKDNTYRVSDQTINSLEIDWPAGEVKVIPYDGEDILIEETARHKINKDNCLRYKIDDGSLQINYLRGTGRIESFGNLSKKLTIRLPRSLAKDLRGFTFDAVSADLHIRDLHIVNLDVDTTSGNLSGINIETRYVNMSTVSGDMKVTYASCPKELNMDSTSGDCTVSLPRGSGVTAELDSVSGDFSSEFSTRLIEDEVYVIGDGDCEFTMGTVSGDFTINKTTN